MIFPHEMLHGLATVHLTRDYCALNSRLAHIKYLFSAH